MRHQQVWMAAGTLLAAGLLAGGCSSTTEVVGTGTGGAGGGGGSAGLSGAAGGPSTASCPDNSGPVDPTAMIDDMEAPDPTVLMVGGRNGSWWSGGDMVSTQGSITPDGNASAELIPGGGRCGSHYAMHVTGHGFTSWAVLTVSFRYGSVDGGAAGLLPYDAHDRTGITFWARIGDTSADQVRFGVSDMYSRPEGGICDVSMPSGSTACYDTFGVDLASLDTRWTQYRIPFSGLVQRNFGLEEKVLDTSTLYTIEFSFAANETFDFWVDDIAFFGP
ncbi:MAG TPA: hypothetical protein VN962_09930 [Polyangia bacterium]|nr:hypothetical protein [Polyangia bacterium]